MPEMKAQNGYSSHRVINRRKLLQALSISSGRFKCTDVAIYIRLGLSCFGDAFISSRMQLIWYLMLLHFSAKKYNNSSGKPELSQGFPRPPDISLYSYVSKRLVVLCCLFLSISIFSLADAKVVNLRCLQPACCNILMSVILYVLFSTFASELRNSYQKNQYFYAAGLFMAKSQPHPPMHTPVDLRHTQKHSYAHRHKYKFSSGEDVYSSE